MNRRELLDRLAFDPEERLLLSRGLDKLNEARERNIPAVTGFLSPGEQESLKKLIAASGAPRHLFFGGRPEAERQVCLFLPHWMEEESVQPREILRALRLSWYREDSLTHRDILGAVMGLGIRRETVGDILMTEESCDLLVVQSVAGYLLENITKAGRVPLKGEEIELNHLHLPVQEVKNFRDTVAALRLDSVLAAGFSVSRTKAAELIRAGRVSVNWKEELRPDRSVEEGAVISCRGLGKCRLSEVGDTGRKGRIRIALERYL